MDQRDKQNLNFLLSVNEETFRDWLMQASNDDLEYAIEIIRKAKIELITKQIERMDEVSDFKEAKTVIEKIKSLKS